MLLPIQEYPDIAGEASEMSSYTYKLDLDQKRVIGHTDGLEAMVQAIIKIFYTERFAWVIYSQAYGIELESLIGQEAGYIVSVIESRVRDAVLADDRVLDVINVSVEQTGKDTLTFYCLITTLYGEVEVRRELGA